MSDFPYWAELKIDAEGNIWEADILDSSMALPRVDTIAFIIGVELATRLMHTCTILGRAEAEFAAGGRWNWCSMALSADRAHIICRLGSVPAAPMGRPHPTALRQVTPW